MERSLESLKTSRARLKTALSEIQKELDYVEAEIKKAASETPLNDNFFWTVLAPLLETRPKGMTTFDLQVYLKTFGNPVSSNAFSTFLSRSKAKGRLVLDKSTTPFRWKLKDGLQNPFD